jgi:hypothetical protein
MSNILHVFVTQYMLDIWVGNQEPNIFTSDFGNESYEL